MIISNTQASLRDLCERAHYYSYIVGVEPKKLPPAIYRGVVGHSALEQYYLEMKDGGSPDTRLSAAKSVLQKEIARIASETPEEFEQVGLIIKLTKLIEHYADVYRQEEFRVLEVEKDYYTPITPSIQYGVILDLLVEMTKGPYRGDLVVVDHKFVYNFKTVLDVSMDAQLPKMIKTLRDGGYVVSRAMYNQLRYRDLKNPISESVFKREWTKPKKIELDTIWDEQKKTALELETVHSLPKEVVQSEARRTLNLLVCRSCLFQKLCRAELVGDSIRSMLITDYQKSSSPWRNTDMGEVA
jgi:hypothetical protein